MLGKDSVCICYLVMFEYVSRLSLSLFLLGSNFTTEDRTQLCSARSESIQTVLNDPFTEKDSQYEMLEDESRRKLLTASKEIEDLRKKEMSFQVRFLLFLPFCCDVFLNKTLNSH